MAVDFSNNIDQLKFQINLERSAHEKPKMGKSVNLIPVRPIGPILRVLILGI